LSYGTKLRYIWLWEQLGEDINTNDKLDQQMRQQQLQRFRNLGTEFILNDTIERTLREQRLKYLSVKSSA
jgi:hypothetical protein